MFQPLFLYYPQQAVHSSNYINPLEAPWKYLKNFQFIRHNNRRLFAGLYSFLRVYSPGAIAFVIAIVTLNFFLCLPLLDVNSAKEIIRGFFKRLCQRFGKILPIILLLLNYEQRHE